MKPNNRIFAAILGMNPQIVTESIFAILNENIENAPTEIYVLSTSLGIARCKEKLIDKKWLNKVFEHFNLKCPEFNETNCITFIDDDDKQLEDIRTREESESAANIIFDHIANWCNSENNQLHLSAAGGRKTSDIHAVLAMSVCSRQIDRLSTIYVSDERVENTPDFFFPSQPLRELKTHKGKIIDIDVRDITLDLVDIEYVRLKSSLPERTFCTGASRRQIISMARSIFEHQKLEINYQEFSIYASDIKIKLSPIQFAIYSWLIEEKLKEKVLSSTANLSKKIAISIANKQLHSFSNHIENKIDPKTKKGIIDAKSVNTLNDIEEKLIHEETKIQFEEGAKKWAAFKTRRLSDIKTEIKKVLKEDKALYSFFLFETFDAEGNIVGGHSKLQNLRLEIAIKAQDIKLTEG